MSSDAQASHLRIPTSAPEPGLPAWVLDLTRERDGARFRRVRAGFSGVGRMDAATFQRHVTDAYHAVFGALRRIDRPFHPIRFWSFVPGIHDDLGGGLDRYKVFNVGRHAAFVAHFGSTASFAMSVPTASAVGVHGDQLVLHCLAADDPGLPVENPRQVPAYQYSRRFGPLPPCFARATLLGAQTADAVLLVGGTASITGEDSRHAGDLQRQTFETFVNLARLVASARGVTLAEHAPPADLAPLLATFRDLRVYYRRPLDRTAIAAFIRTSFPPPCRVELLPASLCRAELLIEIEGVAHPWQLSES